MKKLQTILLAGVLIFSVSSCTFLDATPENVVSEEDNNKAKTTVYANFIGLFTLLQEVADDLIFVSELRGDLLEPTPQAPLMFQDIQTATATADNNELVNPAKYYKIVMNSNDFLRNTVEYNAKFPGVIPTATYRQLIGGAICVRTWAYLTIAKLYGGAVYYDYSLSSEIDLSKLPYLGFDKLIDELVSFMTGGVDNVSGLVNVNVEKMFDLADKTDKWQLIAIQPDILLTELYLWQGERNNGYQNAARRGINMITGIGVAPGGEGYEKRYILDNGWSDIYNNNDAKMDEGITGVFYDKDRNQTNKLESYFRSDRDYYLSPTDRFVKLFHYSWEGIPANYPIGSYLYYLRREYQRLGNSVKATPATENYSNPNLEVNKFSRNDKAENDNTIYIYRAGELMLMIAEALNHTERFAAADSLVNFGANQIGDKPGTYAFPFNTPIWSFDKIKNLKGIRRRGDYNPFSTDDIRLVSIDYLSPELLEVYELPEEEQILHPDYQKYIDRRVEVLDSLIADETARELAFEGKRWFTLLRMARNLKKEDFLAVPVSNKYPAQDQASMLFHFRNENNWFFDDGIKKK